MLIGDDISVLSPIIFIEKGENSMSIYEPVKIWDKDENELNINELSKNMYVLIQDKNTRYIDAVIVNGVSPSVNEVDAEVVTEAISSLVDVDVYNTETEKWENKGIIKEEDILSADFVDDGVILRFYEPEKNADGSRNIVTTLNIEDSSSFDLLADSQGTFIASISLNTFSEVMCAGDVNDVEIDLELVPLSSMIEWIKRYKKSIMRII